jgi:hypothetical protein
MQNTMGNANPSLATVKRLDELQLSRSASVAASTAVTTASATTPFDKTATIPKNSLTAGSTIHVRLQGINTGANASNRTLQFILKLNSTAILTSAAVDVEASDTFMADAFITIRTVGPAGTFVASGIYQDPDLPQSATVKSFLKASTAIDTTADQVVSVDAVWAGGAGADLSARLDILDVEVKRT